MGNIVAKKPTINEARRIYPSTNTTCARDTYSSNAIHTKKYNVFTFIPKNLFEQFHRFANIYFVFILILNFLPEIEAFGREVAPIPVVFVLAVTAIKDLVEDFRRARSDRKVNESRCDVFNHVSNEYEMRKWQDVLCGDLIKMRVNETVPADMVLLYSGDQTGICHLETANIDGESNLKMREVAAFPETEMFQPSILDNMYFEVESPNKEIYKFAGTIYREGESRGIALRKNNLLLRGCTLRNTVEVIGIVVYTGKETKAMLNNNSTRFKRSKLERQINKDVIWCALLLILLCLSCSMGNLAWNLSSFSDISNNFYPFKASVSILIQSSPMQAFLTFWTTVIYYQAMIPLPLYVTFELVKMHQVYHIRQDLEMYDEDAKRGLEVRAFNIPEDLGQIQYIFCDKTGTLTENKMEFKRACIRGTDYLDMMDTEKVSTIQGNGTPGSEPTNDQQCVNEGYEASMVDLVNLIRNDTEDMYSDKEPVADVIRDMFKLMAICNTTVVSLNKNEKKPVIKSKKPDLRSKIKKGFLSAGEGMMSKAASLSAFNAKTLFTKTGRASIKNMESKEIDNKDLDNNSMHLLKYSRRESVLQVFGAVEILVNDKPVSDTENQSRKVKSVLDFRQQEVENIFDSSACNTLQADVSNYVAFPSSNNSQCDPSDLPDISNCSATDNMDSSAKCPITDEVLFASYESESPDEMALVKTACKYGYKLLQRGPGFVTIWNPESAHPVTYKVLQVLPFDSIRKRMSIIIQCNTTNEIIMYCKGADSSMFGRLSPNVSQKEIEETKDYIEVYARKGLRTLVMGKKVICKSTFEEWEKRYRQVEQKLTDNENELSTITSEMEKDMILLGVTGIEDCLQDGVPDTIEALRQAGITIWILTGDKRETAINIAYSAKLFTDNQRLIRLSAESKEEAHEMIMMHLAEIERKCPPEIMEIRQGRQRPLIRQDLALCVDGETLTLVMSSDIKMDFLRLAEQCRSVVCARTTPLQKAEMVQLIKENLRMQTLAIGDGANDVSMIQAADVGVGIGGNEGMQAVMASDFAMTKFKHLKRLLLVHGSWCYNKLARTALWMFYKDTIYILLMFWFQFYNAFSATVQIDQLTQILFNITMTGLPPIIYGIWDKDHMAQTLMKNPQMYTHGINCKSYKPWHFWVNILDSVWQSLTIFFICYGVFTSSDIGIWEFGQVITTCALITCIVHLGIETRFWTWFHLLGLFISVILAYFVFTIFYNYLCGPVICYPDNPNYFIIINMQRPLFWLLCVITPAVALLPRLAINIIMNSLHPNMLVKAQIREQRLGKGKCLHFDYEPELVSVKRSETFLSTVFRRPTLSDLKEINPEYGITEHTTNPVRLRSKKLNSFTSNPNCSSQAGEDRRIKSVPSINTNGGFFIPELSSQPQPVQQFDHVFSVIDNRAYCQVVTDNNPLSSDPSHCVSRF